MNRDEFVSMMIAELSRQREEDAQAFEKPTMRTPSEIFHKLCFDYPEVSGDELSSLGTSVETLSRNRGQRGKDKPTGDDSFDSKFYLNKKFIENLVFLSSSFVSKPSDAPAPAASSASRPASQEDISFLNSAVFLSLPSAMLSYDQRRMSAMFSEESVREEGGATEKMLPWDDIISRYEAFVLLCSSSVVLGGVSGESFLRQGFLSALLSTIQLLNPEEAGRPAANKDALLGQLRSRTGTRCRAPDLACQGKSDLDNGDEQQEEEQGVSKLLWVHLVLVAKDILIHLPAAVPLHMQALLDTVVSPATVKHFSEDQHAYLFAPKSFPNAQECLYILVVSQTCSSMALKAIRDRSARTIVGADDAVAGYFLVNLVTTMLQFVTSILERMLRHNGAGGSSAGSEAIGYLCGVCDVCLSVDFPAHRGAAGLMDRSRRRAKLLEDWGRWNLFPILSAQVADLFASSLEAIRSSGELAETKDAVPDVAATASSAPSHAYVSMDAVHSLSSAMLQRPQIADQALKVITAKAALSDMRRLFEAATPLSGVCVGFLIALSSSTVLSQVHGDRALVDSAILSCLGSVCRAVGADGDPSSAAAAAAGLQRSLDLLLTDFIGIAPFQAFLARHRAASSGYIQELSRLVCQLFDELGARPSSSAEEEEEGSSGLEERAFRHKGGRAALGAAQADVLRVQVKKIKALLNDEPAGAAKTD